MTTGAYLDRLLSAVAAIAPVRGIEVAVPGDPASVTIRFDDTATDEQRAAAAAVVAAFDWIDPPARTLTPLQWLERLPIDRQIAVMEAVQSSPPARLWWLKLQLAVEIDLDSPLTTGGVAYLVAGGVLTTEDATALLA